MLVHRRRGGEPVAEGVRLILSFDAMHSDEWTERAVMGWNSELDKLGALILARKVGGQRR